MARAKTHFILGRIFWSDFRDQLKRIKLLHDPTFDWVESSGWFERRFDVVGERHIVEALIRTMKKISENMEKE